MIRVPLLLLALLGVPVQAQVLGEDADACTSGRGPAVLVQVAGLKNREGTIRAELFPATKEDFLKDDYVLKQEGKPFRRAELRVPASGNINLCLRVPAAGRYAINVVHSTDGVRKFNFRQHGVGFSNNPKLGWSQPDVSKVTVTIGTGVTEIPVTLNYLRGLAMRPLDRVATPPTRMAEGQ